MKDKYNIKFSENYFKLPTEMPFDATLLQCIKIHYDELSKYFRDYDTSFKDGYYILPKTDLILMILLANYIDTLPIFTTIRRYTPKKWEFYKSLEGQEVGIVRSNG